jgi:hypothetical protein
MNMPRYLDEHLWISTAVRAPRAVLEGGKTCRSVQKMSAMIKKRGETPVAPLL